MDFAVPGEALKNRRVGTQFEHRRLINGELGTRHRTGLRALA